jgi:hypothetical protein
MYLDLEVYQLDEITAMMCEVPLPLNPRECMLFFGIGEGMNRDKEASVGLTN